MAACVFIPWDVLLTHLPFGHLPYASDINLAFDFDKSWDDMGMSPRSVKQHLSEASNRGIVMRAYWAWITGKIPPRTRVWLINREEQLLPFYKLRKGSDGRYIFDYVHGRRFSCEQRHDVLFVDGEDRYVESYTWDRRQRFYYGPSYNNVPVLSFIDKLNIYCCPRKRDLHQIFNLPTKREEFFRVLRRLPSSFVAGPEMVRRRTVKARSRLPLPWRYR